MNRNAVLLLMCLFLFVTAGCISQHASNPAAPSTPTTSTPSLNLSTGSWSDGPEFDRLQAALDKSNANIRLDVHHGIEWYDVDNESWESLDSVDSIRERLEDVAEKSLVCIGTGKVLWDKEKEYIQQISGFAKTTRFRYRCCHG